jgi:hypothetical protein
MTLLMGNDRSAAFPLCRRIELPVEHYPNASQHSILLQDIDPGNVDRPRFVVCQ